MSDSIPTLNAADIKLLSRLFVTKDDLNRLKEDLGGKIDLLLTKEEYFC